MYSVSHRDDYALRHTKQFGLGGGNYGGDDDRDDGDDFDDYAEEEESIEHFQWEKPEEFAKEEAVLLGWASIINHSEYLRTHAAR